MNETSVPKPVMAYSPITSMNYQWTIHLHDGYPPLQVLLLEEYIPPSLHTLCYLKPTMFLLGDDYHCPTKILLPPGDNGGRLRAKVTRKVIEVIENCRILRLTTLNSLLQYVNWLVWEVCSVN